MTTNSGVGDKSFESISLKSSPIVGTNYTLSNFLVRTVPSPGQTSIVSPKSASVREKRYYRSGRDQTESAHDDKHRARSIVQVQPIWRGWTKV